MFDWLFRKKSESLINQTKKVVICGVPFTIRKISVIDHLAGAHVLFQSYDIHKTPGAKAQEEVVQKSADKIKRHYSDVIIAGVVDPEIVWKKSGPDDKRIVIDDLLPNWEVVEPLYSAIVEFTYGKKKVRQLLSRGKSSSKSTR